jgi:hypothetical protein
MKMLFKPTKTGPKNLVLQLAAKENKETTRKKNQLYWVARTPWHHGVAEGRNGSFSSPYGFGGVVGASTSKSKHTSYS